MSIFIRQFKVMLENKIKSSFGDTEIVAVLISVTENVPKVLTVENSLKLPHGPLSSTNISLQKNLHQWVYNQTKHPLGYVEQLYTFVDAKLTKELGHYVIYIGYLGLVREQQDSLLETAKWLNWYHFFPWEDHRRQRPYWIDDKIIPVLRQWINQVSNPAIKAKRIQRVNMCWGVEGYEWNEDYVLQRYELLYEVGLIMESPYNTAKLSEKYVGYYMLRDYRRVLATAMARLRAKIKYRPVIYELMPAKFTLFHLQQCVEALSGIKLYKQNFRRLIVNQNLIEPIGGSIIQNRGRPAQLYRFRDDVLQEREITGSKLPMITTK